MTGPAGATTAGQDAQFVLTTNFVGEIDLTFTGATSFSICSGLGNGATLTGNTLSLANTGAVTLCATRSTAGDVSVEATALGLTRSSLGWRFSGNSDCQVFADFTDGLTEVSTANANATFDAADIYDLAIAKVGSATIINPDGTVTFTITVKNQGSVNSGDYTVTDTLPVGTAATGASDAGIITPTTVTWNLTGLAAGATRSVTATVAITDITKRPFKNIAEISADSGDDIDSTPDVDTANDNGSGSGDGYGSYQNPTNDLTDVADVDSQPNGQDDADVAYFDTPVLYDLALVKTGPATITAAGTATFTIQIKNQGNVASGNFTVVDTIPDGLSATAASNGGSIAGQQVTWNLSGLAAGAVTSVTVTVQIADIASRPWVNIAEVTSDDADLYDSIGYENPSDGDVEDDDSTPDIDTSNDVLIDQTTLPATQSNDASVDEDDHDVAPLDTTVVYDLALVKTLPAGQSYRQGSNISFTIVVKNQGNVNSGPITLHDAIPAGLQFVSASDDPIVAGQTVSWDITNLAPGDIKTITLVVKMVDVTRPSYINFAEIISDGADAYDVPGTDVEDKDSFPDNNMGNDSLVDTDDVNIDTIPGDEDDHDRAMLDTAQVRSDNPVVGPLPATGADSLSMLGGAAGLTGLGLLVLVGVRRRRRAAVGPTCKASGNTSRRVGVAGCGKRPVVARTRHVAPPEIAWRSASRPTAMSVAAAVAGSSSLSSSGSSPLSMATRSVAAAYW